MLTGVQIPQSMNVNEEGAGGVRRGKRFLLLSLEGKVSEEGKAVCHLHNSDMRKRRKEHIDRA